MRDTAAGEKMGYWIPLLFIIFAGGAVHSITGFGCGLVIMIVLPHLMPMTQAAAMSTITGGILSASLIWRYRGKLDPRFVILTAIPYLAVSVTMLQFVRRIDTRVMAIVFGAFLVLIGLYYIILSGKAHLRITPVTMLVCPAVSGLTSALFGIGGPLMSLLYLEKYETRAEYASNLQMLFFISAVTNTTTRVINGIITTDLLPTAAAGVAAILLGKRVGLYFADRMKPDLLRKAVYLMVLFSGVITILNNI